MRTQNTNTHKYIIERQMGASVLLLLLLVGMDTEKETKEPYRPGFMQHFDRKNEGKGGGGKKMAPVGPQSVYAYFPCIPDGMDFKEYVSQAQTNSVYNTIQET